jgi:hypothetical protein
MTVTVALPPPPLLCTAGRIHCALFAALLFASTALRSKDPCVSNSAAAAAAAAVSAVSVSVRMRLAAFVGGLA